MIRKKSTISKCCSSLLQRFVSSASSFHCVSLCSCLRVFVRECLLVRTLLSPHVFFLSVIVVVVVLCLLFSFFLLFVLFLNIILYCILCNIYHLRQLILTFMKRRHGRTGPAAGTRGSRICDAKKRCLPVRLFAFFVCLSDVTLCALVLLLVFMRFFSPVHPTAGSSPALIYIRFTFQHMCVCVSVCVCVFCFTFFVFNILLLQLSDFLRLCVCLSFFPCVFCGFIKLSLVIVLVILFCFKYI